MKQKIYLLLLSSLLLNQLSAQSNEFDVQNCDDEQHQISIMDRDNYIVELSNGDATTHSYGKNPIIRKYVNGQPAVFSTMLADIYPIVPSSISGELHHGSYAVGLVEGEEVYFVCSAALNSNLNYPRWEIRLTKIDKYNGQVIEDKIIDTGEPIHFRPRVFKSIDGDLMIAGTLDTSNVNTQCGLFGILPTFNHKGYRSEDMFILKLDESFNVLASIKDFSFGGLYEVPYDIEGDGQENYFLVGLTNTTGNPFNRDIGVAKIDNSLNNYIAKGLNINQEEATVIKRRISADGTTGFVVGFNHDNSCGIFQMDDNLNIWDPMVIRQSIETMDRYVHDLKLNMDDPRKIAIAGYEYSEGPLQIEGACLYDVGSMETVPFYSIIDIGAATVDVYMMYPPTYDSQQDFSRVYPVQRMLTYTEDNSENHLTTSVNNSAGNLNPRDLRINFTNGINYCYGQYCFPRIEHPNFKVQDSDNQTNYLPYVDSWYNEPYVSNIETYYNCNPYANNLHKNAGGGIQVSKTNNQLSVSANLISAASGASITVYSMEGKVVFEKEITNELYKGENTIDLIQSSLSSGLYVLRFTTQYESYSAKIHKK